MVIIIVLWAYHINSFWERDSMMSEQTLLWSDKLQVAKGFIYWGVQGGKLPPTVTVYNNSKILTLLVHW